MRPIPKAAVVLAALATLIIPWAERLSAETFEPHLVISVASYDELKNDLRYIGSVFGNPQLADALEGLILLNTRGQGLRLWDRTRRWGVVVQLDAQAILRDADPAEASSGVLVLPISNLKQFLSSIEGLVGVAESIEQGVFRVSSPQGGPLYFKQQGPWVVATSKQELLAAIPSNPTTLLQGVGENYDLAIQVNFGRFPAELQDRLVKQVLDSMETGLERRPNESEEEFAARKEITDWLARQLSSYYADLDQMVWGVSIDRTARKVAVDFAITAIPESVGARLADRLAAAQSRFLALSQANPSITFRVSAPVGDTLAWEVERGLEKVRQQVLKRVAEEPDQEKAQLARTFINKLMDMLIEILAKSNVDLAFAAWGTPGEGFAVIAAETISGKKVNELLLVIEQALRKDPDLQVAIRPEIEQVNGVTIHRVLLKIPSDVEDREKVVKFFGQEEIELTAAVGERTVFFAIGRETTQRIKDWARAAAVSQKVQGGILSLEMDLLSLATWAENFSPEADDREAAARLAEALTEAGGSGKVQISAAAIPRGLRFRGEIDGAALKALTAVQVQAAPGLPPPFGPAPRLPVPGIPAPPAPRF
jgi:hypothetical protein